MKFVNPVTVEGVELERAWITPTETARIHLLPAYEAPVCIVIRRRPSKLFHIIRWDMRHNRLAHGSWFHGKLYPFRCDVSWDGQWMVYLAMGSDGETWNGLCRPPWLRTAVDSPNVGTWAGGGVFTGKQELSANTMWHSEDSLSGEASVVNGISIKRVNSGGEDEPVLHSRLVRDGWRRIGKNYGSEKRLRSISNKYFVANIGDDGWEQKPSKKHPALRMRYQGYYERGRTFQFELEGYSDIVNSTVEWATWDSRGHLLVAWAGCIRRFTLKDLRKKKPSYEYDLNELERDSC